MILLIREKINISPLLLTFLFILHPAVPNIIRQPVWGFGPIFIQVSFIYYTCRFIDKPSSLKYRLLSSLLFSLSIMHNEWLVNISLMLFLIVFSGNIINFLKNYFNLIPLIMFGLHASATFFRWFHGTSPHKTFIGHSINKFINGSGSSIFNSKPYENLFDIPTVYFYPYLIISLIGLFIFLKSFSVKLIESNHSFSSFWTTYRKAINIRSLLLLCLAIWMLFALPLFWSYRNNLVYTGSFFVPSVCFAGYFLSRVKTLNICIFIISLFVFIQIFTIQTEYYDKSYWNDRRALAASSLVLEKYNFLLKKGSTCLLPSHAAIESAMLMRGKQKNIVMSWEYPLDHKAYSFWESDVNAIASIITKMNEGKGAEAINWTILLSEQLIEPKYHDNSDYIYFRKYKYNSKVNNFYNSLFNDPNFIKLCLSDGSNKRIYILISLVKYPFLKFNVRTKCFSIKKYAQIGNLKYQRYSHLSSNLSNVILYSR